MQLLKLFSCLNLCYFESFQELVQLCQILKRFQPLVSILWLADLMRSLQLCNSFREFQSVHCWEKRTKFKLTLHSSERQTSRGLKDTHRLSKSLIYSRVDLQDWIQTPAFSPSLKPNSIIIDSHAHKTIYYFIFFFFFLAWWKREKTSFKMSCLFISRIYINVHVKKSFCLSFKIIKREVKIEQVYTFRLFG